MYKYRYRNTNTEMKIWTIESSIPCFLRQLPRLWPCPPYKPYNACWPYNAHTPLASKCLVFPFSPFHIFIFSMLHISRFSTFHISIFVSEFKFPASGMLMVIILSPRHRWGLRGSPCCGELSQCRIQIRELSQYRIQIHHNVLL